MKNEIKTRGFTDIISILKTVKCQRWLSKLRFLNFDAQIEIEHFKVIVELFLQVFGLLYRSWFTYKDWIYFVFSEKSSLNIQNYFRVFIKSIQRNNV